MTQYKFPLRRCPACGNCLTSDRDHCALSNCSDYLKPFGAPPAKMPALPGASGVVGLHGVRTPFVERAELHLRAFLDLAGLRESLGQRQFRKFGHCAEFAFHKSMASWFRQQGAYEL